MSWGYLRKPREAQAEVSLPVDFPAMLHRCIGASLSVREKKNIMPAPNEITPTQLMRLVGTPEVPGIVDLRIDEDFDSDPRLVPGAFRCSHTALDSLIPRFTGKPVVVYCQKGRKISQGAAALLRNEAISVEVLEGGQFAWRDADLPMVDGTKSPLATTTAPTRWVTRHRPKIDRIACPWLIRRFIDPAAQFYFVPPQDVELVAEKFNATPFDIEGIHLSHHGTECSFDAFLGEFGLQTEALDRMALIVRGADTNRHELAPEAAGILAISLGLSRMFRDDLAQLNAGMILFDALYRWSRDATDEGHDWPATSVRK